MKKYFVKLILIFTFLIHSNIVSAVKSLNSIEKTIKKAYSIWDSNPILAEEYLYKALNDAAYFTNPSQNNNVREKAFTLISGCLHPSLYLEVRWAIDTYLKTFPNGKNKPVVLINKAILDYSEGRYTDAEEALAEAAKLAKGKTLEKVRKTTFQVLLGSGKYRSAEKYLREWEKEKATRNVKLDIKRFEKGHKIITELLDSLEQTGEIDLKIVRKALEKAYFATDAPEATLVALGQSDYTPPLLHGVDVHFQGKVRTSLHRFPAFYRAEKLGKFLRAFPEAHATLRGTVMLELRSIYLHELKNFGAAEYWRKCLEQIPEWTEKAQLEAVLEKLSNLSIDDPKALELLRQIGTMRKLLPYDNGWLPVLTKQDLQELLVYALLLNEHYTEAAEQIKLLADFNTLIPQKAGYDISSFKEKSDIERSEVGVSEENLPPVGTIPSIIFLLIAADQKELALKKFEQCRDNMTTKDKLFVKDFLYPLWKIPTRTDRRILLAYVMSKRFPKTAIDILLREFESTSQMSRLDYALALLADLYQQYRNYMEAQNVWATMKTLFPYTRCAR